MPDTLPISVLLLARDEAGPLDALLPTLGFARETIVVIDPRGTAETRAVASRHGARVLERAFDGFGPQRQFALDQCTQPWVLWIDADERLVDLDRDALAARLEAAAAKGSPRGFTLLRIGYFLGRRILFCGWRDERVLRIFAREGSRFDDAPVHERVLGVEPKADLEAPWLEHRSYESWDQCVAKMIAYAHAGAEKAWALGRRAGPLDVALRPPLRFLRMAVLQLGILDGAAGVVLCGLAAAQVFLKYAELWERSRGARLGGGG
jgi:hypothetical protein